VHQCLLFAPSVKQALIIGLHITSGMPFAHVKCGGGLRQGDALVLVALLLCSCTFDDIG
jgi:hypothetical protein